MNLTKSIFISNVPNVSKSIGKDRLGESQKKDLNLLPLRKKEERRKRKNKKKFILKT